MRVRPPGASRWSRAAPPCASRARKGATCWSRRRRRSSARPPSPGAQLLSVDEAAARRLPGVVAVVRDGNFLAVAAEREEQAIRAREALTRSARWKEAASLPPTGEALYQRLMSSPAPGETVVEKASPVADAPVQTI